MKLYELYINDQAIELEEGETISLLYQSPIFGDLDSIQSNRSYNIAIPQTQRNKAALELINRVDTNSSIVYTKMPARLYIDGNTIFEGGYAIVTDIDDNFNVTLTWGNIDNFQDLFDENLSELSSEFTEEEDQLLWDSTVSVVTESDNKLADFFKMDFGMGAGNIQYTHPSARVSAIVGAIESRHGITFENNDTTRQLWDICDGAEDGMIPIISTDYSVESEKLYMQKIYWGWRNLSSNLGWEGEYLNYNPDYILKDDLQIIDNTLITSSAENVYKVDAFEKIKISFKSDGGEMVVRTPYAPILEVMDYKTNDTLFQLHPDKREYVGDSELNTYVYYAYFNDFEAEIDVDGIEGLRILLVNDTDYPSSSAIYSIYTLSNTEFSLSAQLDNVSYPALFPITPNLPDITQGEFISDLMSMQGLFAYPDTDDVNKINLFSVDDLYTAIEGAYTLERSTQTATEQQPNVISYNDSVITYNGVAISYGTTEEEGDTEVTTKRVLSDTVTDWSDCVVLNEWGDVNSPEATEFSVDGYAQINNLDYDNDDEIEDDTSGQITIDDQRLDEDEEEIYTSSFSATQDNIIPLYTQDDDDDDVSYDSGLNPRILAYDPTSSTPLYFPKSMWFGGAEGIVAQKYTGLQRILTDLKIITLNVRLSYAQIKQARFEKPIYLSQYGCFFALYSLETDDSGIHEAKLIKLT